VLDSQRSQRRAGRKHTRPGSLSSLPIGCQLLSAFFTHFGSLIS